MTEMTTTVAPPFPAPVSSPPVPVPSAAAASATPSKTTSTGGGVKETVESILVAFILAFVFRAFVVEAFVIPTGSMATTLLGAHTRYVCPDCGYAFDMNFSDPHASEDEDVPVPATAGPITTPVYCPNCGFQMPPDQVANPPVAYGDRILVLKYQYLVQPPSRWDVVVFKAPPNPNQNFIKRLIGKPGEAVMILDGDVYIRPPNDPDPRHFVVQPKPPAVQDAMWRLVYDNDFHPAGVLDRAPDVWQQPWRVSYGVCRQSGPESRGGREFAFDDLTAGAKLDYNVDADPFTQRTADYLVYDQNTVGGNGSLAIPKRSAEPGNAHPEDVPVSDLDVRLTYQRTAGAGPFAVAITKRDHTFRAELTATSATLYDEVGGVPTAVGTPAPLPPAGRPVRVELSNADYQVTLRIDGRTVAQTTPAQYHPDLPALLHEYESRSPQPMPAISLRADGQQSTVSHLSLWRDVYYYNDHARISPAQWATPEQFPDHAQLLKPDEFFCMGDNSQLSWDARCWTQRLRFPAEDLYADAGRVPGRFLLGKAFYVYWPAGYRATGWLPALIPNFAGMRLIH